MKVLVYSAKNFEIPYLERANKGKHKLIYTTVALSSKTAQQAVGYQAVSIFAGDQANILAIEKLKDFGIKYIALRSAGYDNVNLRTAARLGIKVANAPGYSPHAIAEHAVSLLLTLNRKLIVSNDRVTHFNFNLDHLIGYDLHGKTVGIIGTGKIGSVMTKIMHGFGCELLGHDLVENKTLVEDYDMSYVTLEDLCKKSDIITLHLPLTTETHYLINADLIDKMKPGVVIINTARGAIINTEDVIRALENKHISALGLDVYENETGLFFKDHSQEIIKDELLIKLHALANVLITGHHAFLTEEALTQLAKTTIHNLDCWEGNEDCENELTQQTETVH